jgi:hypothetical protein
VTNGDDLSERLVSEAGGQVHHFHVQTVIVHTFSPVNAHCFHLKQNFTGTGLALGPIFHMKDFGTTVLVETNSSRHNADLTSREEDADCLKRVANLARAPTTLPRLKTAIQNHQRPAI